MGPRHFNEVFFEDVVVPKENLLGSLNQGWTVSTTTLMTGATQPERVTRLARSRWPAGCDTPAIRRRRIRS